MDQRSGERIIWPGSSLYEVALAVFYLVAPYSSAQLEDVKCVQLAREQTVCFESRALTRVLDYSCGPASRCKSLRTARCDSVGREASPPV